MLPRFAMGHICSARLHSPSQTWNGAGWSSQEGLGHFSTHLKTSAAFLCHGLNGMLLSSVLNLSSGFLHSACFHGSFLFQSWHAVWCCLLPTLGNNIFSDSLFLNEWKVFIFKNGKELPFVTPTSIFKKTENRFLIEGERTFSMASMTSRFFPMHMTKTVQIF